MVTRTSCRGPGRVDAGVRRAHCFPESDRGRPNRRLDRALGDGGWDARGLPRPVEADDNVASADGL